MKSRWTFTILLVALAALGVFLRPRTVYELWEARELPFGEDVWPRSSRGALVVLDLDGDGLDDVLWSFPEMVESFSRLPAVAAFRNLGDRRFEPIPVPGIRLVDGPCRAAAAGDFDGDGSPDLLLSVADGKRLFLREGGRFRDVSAEWGVGPGDGASPLALAAADLDRDGRLDFVASGPVGASLYRQVAPGRFRVEGLFDRARTTSVTVLDADADGALDLVFAGVDGLRLLLGDGAGGFRPAGPAMGSLARRRDGEPEARSVGRGDLDGDGFPEVVSTHPRGDATTCHARDAESRYRDVARLSGLAAASRDASGQGVAIFDADNDGDLDIFVASGALREPASRRPRAAAERRLVYERSLFYLNDGGGHFREVGDDFGEAMAAARNVLAALAADLDRDGRLDLLLDRADGPPLVLWNRLRPRPWIRVRLEADPASSSPPEGIGARVEVEAGGRRQHRWVRRSRGHTSGPATVHFGLGDAAAVDVLWIRWPSGQVDRHGGVTAGRDYVAREGGALEPDPGSSPSKRG